MSNILNSFNSRIVTRQDSLMLKIQQFEVFPMGKCGKSKAKKAPVKKIEECEEEKKDEMPEEKKDEAS